MSRYGNRDHIVVGPAGVYLLDTKTPGGIVSVENGVMTVRRREDPDDHYEQRSLAGRMRGAAAELADDLGKATGQRPWVTPVVVIWAPLNNAPSRTAASSGYAAGSTRLARKPSSQAGRRAPRAAGRVVEALPRATSAHEPSTALGIKMSRA